MVLGAMAQTALPRIGIYPDQWYLYYPDSENFKIWQLITHILVMRPWSYLVQRYRLVFIWNGS